MSLIKQNGYGIWWTQAESPEGLRHGWVLDEKGIVLYPSEPAAEIALRAHERRWAGRGYEFEIRYATNHGAAVPASFAVRALQERVDKAGQEKEEEKFAKAVMRHPDGRIEEIALQRGTSQQVAAYNSLVLRSVLLGQK